MFKTIGAGAAMLLGGAFMAGAWNGGSYSRTVDRPPSQVIAALEDMDIRRQPGSPGTDPARSGGVAPQFRVSHAPGWIRWDVMSGAQVATVMWAELTPIDDGKRTRVVAHVERGDAPDDIVSPAFRDTRITMSLFGMALEDELNDLTRPAGDPAACATIMEDFAMSGIPGDGEAVPQRAGNLRAAMGERSRAAMKIASLEQDMRRAGCDTSGRGPFPQVEQRMRPASAPPAQDGVSFEPGKPMVDPTASGSAGSTASDTDPAVH
jgi:hypothetical protein